MRSLLLVLLLASPGWAQDFPPELPPRVPPERMFAALAGFALDEPLSDAGVIDVGIVLASGVPTSDCAPAIAHVNQVWTNTQVAARVRQVGCLVTTYVSSGSANTDLTRLKTSGDGFLDEVHPWRNTIGADEIILLGNSCDACGVGYMLASAASAFAYVCRSCAIGNKSFVHELGHNMGLSHDQPNSGGFSLPHGYGVCRADVGLRCVMTYPSPCGGNRTDLVSNPAVLVGGKPFGNTTTSDGARVLRDRLPIVAGFRPTVVTTRKPSRPVRPRVESL